MTQNAEQQAAPVSERELIEAAAAAAPTGKSTTTQKALDIMEASVIQRKAVAEAFEAQKAAITGAVQEQKAMAVQQVATAKKNHTAEEAQKKLLNADQATQTLGMMTREALGQKPSQTVPETASGAKEPAPESAPESAPEPTIKPPTEQGPSADPAPQQIQQPTPQLASQQPLQQTAAYVAPAPTISGPSAAAPLAPSMEASAPQAPQAAVYNPPTIAGTPVAEELARTIRTIIAQEIDTQLNALLALHTADPAADTPTAD